MLQMQIYQEGLLVLISYIFYSDTLDHINHCSQRKSPRAAFAVYFVERIVLELKDKLKKEKQIEELSTAVDNTNSIKNVIEKDQKLEEAFTALQVLGYSTKDIEKVMEKIDKNLSLEEIIRNGIKELSKK